MTSVRSRRLAYVLRKQRIAAGLSAAELARSVGMSGSKISRFENCESGIYLDDLEKLIDFYGMSKKRRVELLDIARHAEERGWLRLRSGEFPADWQTWVDFEDEATALRSYEPLIIPGLLQTAEYARSIIRATGGALVLQRQSGEWVATSFVVAEAGLVLSSAAEG
ncbi:Scr1 family TA system antitoxin-like transcriptional regulator [Saccharopolyspora gregorii]